MPKIIDGVQVSILKEAKCQVFKNGYDGMTIRSVAQACGIATGTIYNYFPSKEYLTASFVLNDWTALEDEFRFQCKSATKPMEAFRFIYMGIVKFVSDYQPLFRERNAVKSASVTFRSRHSELRERLADIIGDVCMENAKRPSAFLPAFVAEALLAWSCEQRGFEDIRAVLSQLFD